MALKAPTTLRRQLLAGAVGCALVATLAACRSTEEAALPALVASGCAQVARPGPARQGAWLGGPEPASGKLRSGITSYYQRPAVLVAGQAFDLLLRLEDVESDDAVLSLTVGDGLAFVPANAPATWCLPKGVGSQVAVRIAPPPGDSYLHIMTAQKGRSSVRSVLLHAPGQAPATAQPPAATERDASGQPIVRMRAR